MPSTSHRNRSRLERGVSDNEHRTQRWVQLISVGDSSGANDATVARLEKEVEALMSAMQRSRSPRMRPRNEALPSAQGTLALPAPASSSSQSKGQLVEAQLETRENRKLVVARVAQARRVEAKVVLES